VLDDQRGGGFLITDRMLRMFKSGKEAVRSDAARVALRAWPAALIAAALALVLWLRGPRELLRGVELSQALNSDLRRGGSRFGAADP
jgi:peptidoglycan/LPS O-acetylase OafA/YrhL